MGRKAKEAAQQKIGEWTGVQRNVSKVEKAAKAAKAAAATTKPKPAAAPTTTTMTKTNENTNTSNELRSPLQTHSQSEINAMKNCTVRLEKMENAAKQPQQQEMVEEKIPAQVKKATAATATTAKAPAIVKTKPTDAKKVYDFSFDDDLEDAIPLETGQEDAMKDLFDKMAKENKIEVKKYRPKNVRKKKTTDEKQKDAATKKVATVTRKRPREKQATTAAAEQQPPQKRPNLKNNKVTNTDAAEGNVVAAAAAVIGAQKMTGTKPTANVIVTKNANKPLVDANVIAPGKKVTILEDILIIPKETTNTVNKTAINTNQVNAQPKLRNRLLNNFQSTPKSSTPLSTKTSANAKENERSLNSLFFEQLSPLHNVTRTTRGHALKQRLHLSAINDSVEAEASTSSTAHKNAPPAHQQPIDFIDYDDDFDFANEIAHEPQSSKIAGLDKENSLDRPTASTSTATNPSPVKSSAGLAQNRPGPSGLSAMNPPPQASTSAASSNHSRSGSGAMAASSRNSSARSAGSGSTPQNSNNFSNFEMNNTSDYRIFSPTKRRVYGRSPLKNITSEVNNTNSPSFQGFKTPSSMPRSFGVLKRSTLNSTSGDQSSVGSKITLPEASYFTSRRAADDFDRTINDSNLMDEYFGFSDGDGEGDDDDIDNNNDTLVEQSKSIVASDTTSKPSGLDEIRARLKRFLHNPDAAAAAAADPTIKKTKTNDGSARKRAIRTPIKTEVRKPNRTPVKRNIVFADTDAKQKDIRAAFTAKTKQNEKHAKTTTNSSGDSITLFEEVVPNQDRRRSYSRPQRHRKRRISIESEHSDEEEEEEEQQSDDDENDADGKARKRAKRRKKMAELNAKEPEGLDEFARELNAHFDEIDSFELMVE